MPSASGDGSWRELSHNLRKQERRWLRHTILTALATAFVGPLVIALAIDRVWTFVRTGDEFGMIASSFFVGVLGYSTWRATRFARDLKTAATIFDETSQQLRRMAQESYERGRDDAKQTTVVLLREVGQSFANATGVVVDMMFEGERILCRPEKGRHGGFLLRRRQFHRHTTH